MQIEVYRMEASEDTLTITLEAVCDTFSSLIWDIEYYKCGSFEVYIAANPHNIETFQTGRIVGRDDDNQHFGIIESVLINTDIENGDYLTVRGRFLMCLLERRIIHPTYNVTAAKAYSEIVREVVTQNALISDNRRIPGLSLGTVTGACWEQTATLQISYTNLMLWVYTICEKLGGTANIRLVKSSGEQYRMSIANYLTALDAQRDQLARNLVTMGVQASESEKLNTLVPKVLQIPSGKPEVTLFRNGNDALTTYGESIYTFYIDGYRSIAGFADVYPRFCCAENAYALYYNQPDFNWGAVIYTMCITPVRITPANRILLTYKSGTTDAGEMWLVRKSSQQMSPAETARYIHEKLSGGEVISVPFGWLGSVGNYISVLHDCSGVSADEYYLAWKAVTDNTSPMIRTVKVLEVTT